MRALNSKFNENSPCLSGNGNLLVFTSDRPGGQGGDDIWISKWDGIEYAWPLPLTSRVNTPFDEKDPAFDTRDDKNLKLYFSSNRPHQATDISAKEAKAVADTAQQLEDVNDRKVDFDIFSADQASDNLPELILERQFLSLIHISEPTRPY